MKPSCHLSFRATLVLLLGLAGLVLSAPGKAQDTLCQVLIRVPKQEMPIVRFEMAAAKADHFAAGEDFFTSTRGARRVIFLGTVDMTGKERAELKKYLPPSGAFDGPWDEFDTRVSIATVKSGEGREAMLSVDTTVGLRGKQPDKVVSQGATPGGFHRYTASSQVPFRPNAWQEVAYWSLDHYALMLWQYPLVKGQGAPAANAAKTDLPPLYRLEMTIGILPEETLARLGGYDAKRRRLIAESPSVLGSQWTSFSVHCLPEQPFAATTARGLNGMAGTEGYLESSTCSFSGTLGIKSGAVGLKCEFRTPAPKKLGRLTIPIGADLVPGEWYIQHIREKPVIYDVGHMSRMRNEMIYQGKRQGTLIRANAAIFRVVELKR